MSKTPTVTPAEVSHRITSVGHLGQVAMFTGRTITWDYTTEQIIGDPIANAMLGRESRKPWKLEGKIYPGFPRSRGFLTFLRKGNSAIRNLLLFVCPFVVP